ncbi:Y-family DNA polymerase, partial [Ligilactobacillus aviarius]
MNKVYMAIDLKSFYASVECRERKLDPLDINLVVADESRTDKTICLAVSLVLKSFGVPGRSRLFEVKQRVNQLNNERKSRVLGHRFRYGSCSRKELINNKALEIGFRIARPRMKLYEEVSAYIYSIYLRYIAAEDIHVYSIDEAFIDITSYLKFYNCEPIELADRIISDVYQETGIIATVGIGTNLYLAKVAMDIVAKHMTPTKMGFKVAELNECTYREQLWDHQPITDFWRVGKGYARRLDKLDIHTMGEIAACSLGTLSDHYNK